MAEPHVYLQRAAHDWVLKFPPGHADIWRRLAKLTEEVGELSRAVIGQEEGRANRGDPQQEAAQVCLVLMTIAELLGFDLIDATYAEFFRATGQATDG